MHIKHISSIIVTLTLSIACFASDQAPVRTRYEQPEQLVQALCDAAKRGDLTGAADLFGNDRLVATSLVIPTVPSTVGMENIMLSIPDSPGYADLRRVDLRNKSILSLRYFLSTLLLADDFPFMLELRPFIVPHEGDGAEQLIGKMSQALDPARLGSLRVVRVDRIMPDDDDYAAYADTMIAALELDDFGEFHALFELGGRTYASMLTLLQSPEKGWEIASLFGVFSMEKFRQFNNPFPEITVQEYENLIAQ